ncbi:bifunctional demethylmenaquinone methyltransferase/2-methoxy-6-polyprenyl-1,4-benzoquinol methylase UbiE [Microbacter margulisiae]|uniref:Demethylmenaquinone methyltransferase n=1 Tax=Microbacter margulisiae TaxID=1350067 RepID=A0A7W5H1M1_9PORP|nr:bifunctional demethylmenaquinone methyltransferase/2-methoxy-6-polyprenyl-1,4-benzoquinol methylase UbiE [Microbacter margulisiae]MBB3186512.1 demethylmenaquinone methyltransferase/2-methoxy-6-polyprenyl-1,4-benzoquinol methylase [Microbacter margulisiae]
MNSDSTTVNKKGVRQMFDDIAWRYDFLNHFLTFGIDIWWRRKAIQLISKKKGAVMLDIATGTADLAIALVKYRNPFQVIGVDVSEGMLEFGKQKIQELELTEQIILQQENGEALSFPDNSFDAVTIGFGIRNFEHPDKGLAEMFRVLKPDGELVILEFSRPNNPVLSHIFDLYFCYVLPHIGKIFSKHKTAYTYLPESVKQFPYGKNFEKMMQQAGFSKTLFRPLTLGIVTIYKGTKL